MIYLADKGHRGKSAPLRLDRTTGQTAQNGIGMSTIKSTTSKLDRLMGLLVGAPETGVKISHILTVDADGAPEMAVEIDGKVTERGQPQDLTIPPTSARCTAYRAYVGAEAGLMWCRQAREIIGAKGMPALASVPQDTPTAKRRDSGVIDMSRVATYNAKLWAVRAGNVPAIVAALRTVSKVSKRKGARETQSAADKAIGTATAIS